MEDSGSTFDEQVRRRLTEKKNVFRLLPESDLKETLSLAVGAFALSAYFAPSWILVWVPMFFFLVAASYRLKRRELVIGRDGLLISQIGKRRFISYRDLECVNRFAAVEGKAPRHRKVGPVGIVLHLRANEHVSLPILSSGREPKDDLIDAYRRISDALVDWRIERPLEFADALGRGRRTTNEWISSLRQIGVSERIAYREAPLDRDALFAIVEDPVNQASSRAAAAIALSVSLDDEERVRLQTATAAVAQPKLRLAMDHVMEKKADEDLEMILDDLDPIEDKIR